MKVDATTLRDLGIIDRQRPGTDLLSWIATVSEVGELAVLADLLGNPLGDAAAIRRRQGDLRRLARVAHELPGATLVQAIHEVQRYLASRYLELPTSYLPCAHAMLRHADQYASALTGLRSVAKLLTLADRCRNVILEAGAEAGAGGELDAIASAIDALLASPQSRRLLASATGTGMKANLRMAVLDRSLRVDARSRIETCLRALQLLDALAALAMLARQPGFCFPEIMERSARHLELEGLFHSQLDGAVPNDLQLDKHGSVLMVTGPNMAGKSTYLRAVGVSVVLAHVGAPVPAQAARISCCDRLFAVFGARDNLLRAESYFLAEVRRIGELTRALEAGELVLSLIDEAFRGTNVLDASDATTILVEALGECPTSLSVVATHLVEVVNSFAARGDMRLACFEAQHDGATWRYSFRLKPGTSTQRLGMLLLEREGVLASLEAMRRCVH